MGRAAARTVPVAVPVVVRSVRAADPAEVVPVATFATVAGGVTVALAAVLVAAREEVPAAGSRDGTIVIIIIAFVSLITPAVVPMAAMARVADRTDRAVDRTDRVVVRTDRAAVRVVDPAVGT